ncbi:MAG TPA: hypothetical protein VHW44_24085 [Pseudonocardiaceae bacterium]|jgi:hypothetical protein|nr:hypothetical protein [Pseudonocardiaceae bacterium]
MTELPEPAQPVVLMRQLDGGAVALSTPNRLTAPVRSRIAAAVVLAGSGTLAVLSCLLPLGRVTLPLNASDVMSQLVYRGAGTRLTVNGMRVQALDAFWGVVPLLVAVIVAAAIAILAAILLSTRRFPLDVGRPLAATSAGLLLGVVGLFVVEILAALTQSADEDRQVRIVTAALPGTWVAGVACGSALVAIVLVIRARPDLPVAADLDTPPFGLPIGPATDGLTG